LSRLFPYAVTQWTDWHALFCICILQVLLEALCCLSICCCLTVLVCCVSIRAASSGTTPCRQCSWTFF
jgi:hypothetical protein